MTARFRSFFRLSCILLAVLSGTAAGRAAAPERAAGGLRVTAALLGGPIYVPRSSAGYATRRDGVRLPMTVEPWGQEFPILLRVTNLSSAPQSFITQGYTWQENWRARAVGRRRRDELRLREPNEVSWNPPVAVTLKPSECYQKRGVIVIRAAGRPHRVHFRVGFAARPDPGGRLPATESDEITATVTWAPS